MKKAEFLPRPDKNALVDSLISDLEDPNDKPKTPPEEVPAGGRAVLKKIDPANKVKQQSYDMKVRQASAALGQPVKPPKSVKPYKSPIAGFLNQRKKGNV